MVARARRTPTRPARAESKKAGGLGSIAEQTVDHKVDVVLGGGRNRFAQTITGGPGTGKTVEQYAQQNKGYTEVNTAAQLAAAKRSDKPLLGLFSPSTMATEWNGPVATLGEGTPAQKCVTTNRPADQPSLTAMTKKAIDLLEGDRDGFFLQVEGASIDKQDHAANACGQIGEMIEFDNAIAVAQAYARKHPDTLILVTADHAHTSQIVAEDSNPDGTTPNNSPTGYSNNLITTRRSGHARSRTAPPAARRVRRLRRASSTRAPWSRPGARARARGV